MREKLIDIVLQTPYVDVSSRATAGKIVDNLIAKGVTMQPQTNADRIRAMSDEELAFFLAEWNENQRVWRRDAEGELLYWIQEPAETPTTNADTCVCCGAIIPEGGQVCTECQSKGQDKPCAWCKAEYTIIDDDFGQPVHPKKVKFCFNCGRRLR